jgi:restriction system protein
VVSSTHVGFDVQWLIECKAWASPVSKEKVLALRSIVDDVGADRGFMMAERGYQRGALEAARFASVMLTSLADLEETLGYEIGIAGLRSLWSRVELCRERYWAIDKYDRIDVGLRADVGAWGYSGMTVINAVDHSLRQALTFGFPIEYERSIAASLGASGLPADPVMRDSDTAIVEPIELFKILDAELTELEGKLDAAETVLRTRRPHG